MGGTTVSRRTLLKAAGVAGAVVACGPSGAPLGLGDAKPVKGGTLVYANSGESTSLDPHNNADAITRPVYWGIYEGLVMPAQDMKPTPRLSTGWTVEGKVWTFKLRPGVKFHDGTAFNAAAVKANVDRVLPKDTKDRPLRAVASDWVAQIDRFEVVDDMTVRFVTKDNSPFFLNALLDTAGLIISPAAIQKFGKELTRNAVGTGPFKLLQWKADDSLTVERNDDYWGGAPYLDKVVFKPFSDTTQRVIALESGDAHMAVRVNPEHVARLQNAKFNVSLQPSLRHLFTGLAVLKKPFSDVRVRQALNHAIDRETICKTIYLGTAQPHYGSSAVGATGYVPVPPFAYDPAKAKQLLAAAGYPNGFTTNFIGSVGALLKDVELNQAIAQYLRAVGVTVNIQNVDFAKYQELIREDPRKSSLEMWQESGSNLDAARSLTSRYACDVFRPAGGNTHGYCDAEVDKLAYEAGKTVDDAKRAALLKEAQERQSAAAPSIWLVLLKEPGGSSAKVHDAVHNTQGVFAPDNKTWIEP